MNSLQNFENSIKPSNRKFGRIVVVLLVCLLAMAGALTYSTVLLKFDNEHVRYTSNLRLNVFEIIKFSSESKKSVEDNFTQLKSSRDKFKETLNLIVHGDPESDISNTTTPEQYNESLNNIIILWEDHQKHIDTLISSERSIRITEKFIKAANAAIPKIEEASEEIITQLIKQDAHQKLIFIASYQLLLAQRINTGINQIDLDETNVSETIKTLKIDAKAFRDALEGMLKGDRRNNISRITAKPLRTRISNTLSTFATLEELISRLKEQSIKLDNLRVAKKALIDHSDNLLNSINELIEIYENNVNTKNIVNVVGYTFGAISLALLLWLAIAINRITRTELTLKEKSNKKTVDAIKLLQNEIAPIAKGDLTTNTTVAPGITEPIAEMINFTINSLRQLVRNIDSMAIHVSETAEETQSTAIKLARASDQQAQQLTSVAETVNKMSQSFDVVAKQSEESTQLSNKAVNMAEQGGLAVRNTIRGMHIIKEDIYDTSNRIKRLGESSQEIGAVVELINGIADQTNILALNAAIKASVAGEGGQSFTMVADEVQQLAERVTQATQKIESLVKSIQLDTSQAVVSMEQSIGNVINGTKLAEDAGDALLRIETVSAHLAEFINNVSAATLTLTETSTHTSQTMNAIKNLTDSNLINTKQTAALTAKLAELAQEQRAAIHGFKLPS